MTWPYAAKTTPQDVAADEEAPVAEVFVPDHPAADQVCAWK